MKKLIFIPLLFLCLAIARSSTVTYYFNSYDVGEAWGIDPENMTDGSTGTMTGWQPQDNTVQLCDGNTCDGTNLGTISKVELRAYGQLSAYPAENFIRPVFSGTNDGDNHLEPISWVTEAWYSRISITTDTNAPGSWTWTDVKNLDCDIYTANTGGSVKCGKIEIIVTYTAGEEFSGDTKLRGLKMFGGKVY